MKYSNIFFWLLILLWSCRPTTADMSSHGHAHGPDDDHSHDDERIELTSEQMSNAGLQFGRIEQRSLQSVVKIKGRVELPPNGMAVASSPIGGRIDEVLVQPGQRVKAGQRLFTIFNLELIDWQQDYLRAKAEAEYLTLDLNRQKRLSDEELSPVKNYEAVLAKKQQAEATMRGLRSKLLAVGIQAESIGPHLQDKFYVFAPQAGRIEHVNVSKGSYIAPSNNLVEIIDDHHLHLHLQAYGQDIKYLQEGQVLKFFIQSRPENIQTARIKWINNVVDESMNAYDIHAEVVGSQEGLIAGEFVEARVITEEETIPSLPMQALTSDKGLKYIFVVDEATPSRGFFRKVMINTGVSDLGFVEVLPIDPLEADDQIVVNGAFFLMAESKKGEAAPGHSH